MNTGMSIENIYLITLLFIICSIGLAMVLLARAPIMPDKYGYDDQEEDINLELFPEKKGVDNV